jgi:hypothetical protein
LMSTDAAKWISKRFAAKKYLGWSEEDILENEASWKQENAKKVKDKTGLGSDTENSPGLRNVGVSQGGDLGGIEPELGEEPGAEGGEEGGPGSAVNSGSEAQPSAGPVGGGAGNPPAGL